MKRYKEWLIQRLYRLDEIGRLAVWEDQYEQLANTAPPLFSIRHPHSKLNERYIYTMDGDNVILLTVFLEKSKTDYHEAIQRAYRILNKLEE